MKHRPLWGCNEKQPWERQQFWVEKQHATCCLHFINKQWFCSELTSTKDVCWNVFLCLVAKMKYLSLSHLRTTQSPQIFTVNTHYSLILFSWATVALTAEKWGCRAGLIYPHFRLEGAWFASRKLNQHMEDWITPKVFERLC